MCRYMVTMSFIEKGPTVGGVPYANCLASSNGFQCPSIVLLIEHTEITLG